MSVITTSIVANKADAYAKNIATLTSGMAGAEIEFEFSSEWEGLSKTAVFKAGSTTKYVILTTSNKCPIPYECLTTARVNLIVGVYGTNGDNVIIPTIYCSLGLISEGTAVTGSEPGEITQSLYNQVVALIDDCEDELVNVKETAVKQVDVDASGADQVGTVGVSLTTSWVDATDHTKGKKATFVFTNLKGMTGTAATVAAGTTTTGEPGTSASVVNSGTSSAAVFDFTIPKGSPGTDGVSPSVVISDIPGGHRVTITDATHPSGQSFDVLNGVGAGDMLSAVYDAEGGAKQVAFKADLNTVAYSGKSSDLTNDAGFLTEHQSLAAYRTSADQDVIDATKVPTGRTVNGHALTGNVTIADTDIAHGSTTVGAELTEHSSQIVLQSQNLEATQDMISDAWDSTVTYTVGQYCISGNQLYKCKVQHINQQPPNATYWGAVNAGDELQLLNKFETYSATTQNISAGSVVAHKMGKIGMIKIDVTMSISSSSWTNIATFGTELTWEQSGYGLLVNTATGSSLYGQLFLNGSVPTFRVQGGISSGNGIRGTYFFI